MKRHVIGFWAVLVITLVIDQVVKQWTRTNLRVGESTNGPFPGVFEITHTENHGIAFGMFQGGGVFFAPFAIAIAAYAAYYSFKKIQEPWHLHLTMGLLASGAIGNLYDRLAHGKVTDMFWFRAIDFPVFNVADSCITIGAGMLILSNLLEAKPKKSPVKEISP
jgi:signal peptidase II